MGTIHTQLVKDMLVLAPANLYGNKETWFEPSQPDSDTRKDSYLSFGRIN